MDIWIQALWQALTRNPRGAWMACGVLLGWGLACVLKGLLRRRRYLGILRLQGQGGRPETLQDPASLEALAHLPRGTVLMGLGNVILALGLLFLVPGSGFVPQGGADFWWTFLAALTGLAMAAVLGLIKPGLGGLVVLVLVLGVSLWGGYLSSRGLALLPHQLHGPVEDPLLCTIQPVTSGGGLWKLTAADPQGFLVVDHLVSRLRPGRAGSRTPGDLEPVVGEGTGILPAGALAGKTLELEIWSAPEALAWAGGPWWWTLDGGRQDTTPQADQPFYAQVLRSQTIRLTMPAVLHPWEILQIRSDGSRVVQGTGY